MRQFRKKAIAICLASALTVLGAFSAENYKNSLISLKINKGSDGQVSLTAFTRDNFDLPLTTEKVDDNSFSVILPETYSEMASMPNIAGYNNIDSIIISTYPYTPTNKGYTAIHIRTKGNPTISTNTSLYIADKNSVSASQQSNTRNTYTKQQPAGSYWDKLESNKNKETSYHSEIAPQNNYEEAVPNKSHNTKPDNEINNSSNEPFHLNYDEAPVGNPMERFAVFVGTILLSLLILFIYFISKDKMASVVGEKQEFSLDEEKEKEQENSKRKKIKKAINNLDKRYSNQFNLNQDEPPAKETKKEVTQKSVVVDLDSLFSEKNKENNITNEEDDDVTQTNDDLSDFLNDFSFDDIQDIKDEDYISENEPFDDELYNRIINSNEINFSKSDTEKILSLVQNEISEDTIENIELYASKEEKQDFHSYITHLENILAEYTIKQNLTFKKDDVDAITKLMNVELDDSFIHDLRTDPNKTKAMREEIERQSSKQKNISITQVLKVKDMLPDLSAELKKQGKKPIEFNPRAEVVYQSEGYDYSVLSLDDDLLDISKAISQKVDNSYRPSDALKVAEDGYEVQTLSIKEAYPDLANIKDSIKKYNNEHTKKEKANTKALLKSLSNVTFKPFYEETPDNSEEFNFLESFNNESENTLQEESTVQADDIVQEENIVQTENIVQEENTVYSELNQETQEEKTISSEPNQETQEPEIIMPKLFLKKREKVKITPKINDETAKLMAIIEEQQNERKNKQQKTESNLQIKQQLSGNKKPDNNIKAQAEVCNINGRVYDIIKTVECTKNATLCLAKNRKEYIVLGKTDGEYIELKHYDSLRTENIQTRKNDTNSDGSAQYLVRVSIHKFIINVTDNSMEFVMDLC